MLPELTNWRPRLLQPRGSSPTLGQQRCFRGHRDAKAAHLAVGAGRLRCGWVGRSAPHGAARRSQCWSRLPSGSHLQFWPLRLVSRLLVGLHLPGVPLCPCPLCRRRHAARLPAHALRLGRLSPSARLAKSRHCADRRDRNGRLPSHDRAPRWAMPSRGAHHSGQPTVESRRFGRANHVTFLPYQQICAQGSQWKLGRLWASGTMEPVRREQLGGGSYRAEQEDCRRGTPVRPRGARRVPSRGIRATEARRPSS